MINEKNAKKCCCEDISLIENYDEAVNSPLKYDVHHKLGLYLKRQWLIDNGLYYDQIAEMLVFMKRDEHISLHTFGRKRSVETKRKLSELKSGEKHPNFGKHLSDETRHKISKANMGKVRSDETKRKISELNKGRRCSEETRRKMSESHKGEKNHLFGKHLSEEARRKMSESRKGIPNLNLSKAVSQYTKSGEYVATYPSAHEAYRQTGVHFTTISQCCNGIKKSAGGYIWRYKEDV